IMSNKPQFLASIAAIAKKLGRTPSLMEFSIRTRTSRKVAFRYFRKWNDAVKAAGLQPCRVYKRIEEKTLLRDWGETVRKKGGLPSRSAYGLLGNHHPRTLEARFGSWRAVAKAFEKFAKNRSEWDDIVAIISARKSKAKHGFKTAAALGLNAVEH